MAMNGLPPRPGEVIAAILGLLGAIDALASTAFVVYCFLFLQQGQKPGWNMVVAGSLWLATNITFAVALLTGFVMTIRRKAMPASLWRCLVLCSIAALACSILNFWFWAMAGQ